MEGLGWQLGCWGRGSPGCCAVSRAPAWVWQRGSFPLWDRRQAGVSRGFWAHTCLLCTCPFPIKEGNDVLTQVTYLGETKILMSRDGFTFAQGWDQGGSKETSREPTFRVRQASPGILCPRCLPESWPGLPARSTDSTWDLPGFFSQSPWKGDESFPDLTKATFDPPATPFSNHQVPWARGSQ